MHVADWLRDLGCELVSPVEVKIGRTTYYGASYRDRFGCFVMYLLGDRPPSSRRGNVAYRYLAGPPDEHDWYVASWADAAVTSNPQFAKFHPFGAHFQLREWNLSEPIDKFAKRPYKRVNMVLR